VQCWFQIILTLQHLLHNSLTLSLGDASGLKPPNCKVWTGFVVPHQNCFMVMYGYGAMVD